MCYFCVLFFFPSISLSPPETWIFPHNPLLNSLADLSLSKELFTVHHNPPMVRGICTKKAINAI